MNAGDEGGQLYWRLTEGLLADPRVSRGTMMGFPCMRTDGVLAQERQTCLHGRSGSARCTVCRRREQGQLGNSMTRTCEVVIVGGGIAGLTAAYRLRSRDVQLFEASERFGGRLKSAVRGEYWLNLGGHLLGGETGPMGRLATELGIPLITSPGSVSGVSLNGRVLRSSRPELMPFRLAMSPGARWSFIRTGIRLKRAYREARRWDHSGLTGVTDDLSTYPASPTLDGKTYAAVLGPMHPDVAALMRITANRLATEPDRLSGHIGTVDTVGIWEMRRPNVVGGTEEVPKALVRVLGDRLTANATVEAAEGDDTGVTVHVRTESGLEQVRARACIIAAPAPVVRQVVRGLPAAKDEALSLVTYGPFLVLGMFTDERGRMPWDEMYAVAVAKRSFCMFFNPASVFRTPHGVRQPGGALVVYAAGDQAAALMDKSDAQVVDTYLADLREVFPQLANSVRETVIQRWPLGVPVAAPGRARLQPALAAPVGRIAFTGDYIVHPGMDSAIVCSEAAVRTVERLL